MTSPLGADDEPRGALSPTERTMLAAWADEGDPPDDFAERVVARFLAERIGESDAGIDDPSEALDGGAFGPGAGGSMGPAIATEGRAVGEGKVVRLVGFAAAFAAAAAVMLMVRVLPRSAEEGAAETAVAAVQSPEPPAEATGPAAVGERADAVSLAAEAGAVLATHCSPCHDSEDPEAKPEAVRVFDVAQPQWWLTMSDAQLDDTRTRVQTLGAASEDERRRVDAFVEARRRRDAHAG